MNARLVTMVRSWACRTAGFKSGLADGVVEIDAGPACQ